VHLLVKRILMLSKCTVQQQQKSHKIWSLPTDNNKICPLFRQTYYVKGILGTEKRTVYRCHRISLENSSQNPLTYRPDGLNKEFVNNFYVILLENWPLRMSRKKWNDIGARARCECTKGFLSTTLSYSYEK
jgi:hypothetical protein